MTLVSALEAAFSKCSNDPFSASVEYTKKTLRCIFSNGFERENVLCNNSDQRFSRSDTLISLGISEGVETLAFLFEFQHLPRGPADVNAKKIIFDPYNVCVIHFNYHRASE